MWFQKTLVIETPGRGTIEFTRDLDCVVRDTGIRSGLCHIFIQHTSASLMLCENADPDVRQDLETFMSRTVPDGDPEMLHQSEGPDDMSAHIRTVLTRDDLTLPVGGGTLMLGTWQGIYLWEHRTAPHQRRVVVTVQGER